MLVFLNGLVAATDVTVCRKEEVGTVNVRLKYDSRRNRVPVIPEYIYDYAGEPQAAWQQYFQRGGEAYGAADERPAGLSWPPAWA